MFRGLGLRVLDFFFFGGVGGILKHRVGVRLLTDVEALRPMARKTSGKPTVIPVPLKYTSNRRRATDTVQPDFYHGST